MKTARRERASNGTVSKAKGPKGLFCRVSALDLAPRIFEALNSPVSLSCEILLRYGDHKQLAEKKIDPLGYADPAKFFLDYQAVKLLAKYPELKTGIDTELVAYKKFMAAELQCLRTNARMRERASGSIKIEPSVDRIFENAKRKIASILGRVPQYEEMELLFGPGATFGVRKETSPYNKVTADLECTDALVDQLPSLLGEFPGWIVPDQTYDVTVIPGSQLTFVPKDATTDRAICIEPLLNGLVQHGYGKWIRDRLKKVGLNLSDQTVNQNLASLAVKRGLSTVDFASASDTISYLLILELLPIDWVVALDSCRSPEYWDSRQGSWVNFHKFSSMGNTYTFELETLIFYTLARATCDELGIETNVRENISVYGDDVIIPAGAYDLFQKVSEYCGFTINEKKSFREGVFFESCGHDYFDGELVRPFLWKKKLKKLTSAFYAANTIKRIAKRNHQLNRKIGLDGKFRDVYDHCVAGIPRSLRCLGPEGMGDGHLISDFDEATPPLEREFGWCGYLFTSWQERATLVSKPEWPTSYALYGAQLVPSRRQSFNKTDGGIWDLVDIPNGSQDSEGYAVRGRTRIKKVRTFCPSGRWVNMGPWS